LIVILCWAKASLKGRGNIRPTSPLTIPERKLFSRELNPIPFSVGDNKSLIAFGSCTLSQGKNYVYVFRLKKTVKLFYPVNFKA